MSLSAWLKMMAEDDEDQTMDLTIEALTGTVYDLCVSPYETILGIKTKIQRLEGKIFLLYNYLVVYRISTVCGGYGAYSKLY